MRDTKPIRIIKKYRTKEERAVYNIVRRKGSECKVHLTLSSEDNHDTDPFQTDIQKLDRQYATNDLTGEVVEDKIFFIKKDSQWTESNYDDTAPNDSLRNNYIAFFLGVREYSVGDIIELKNMEESRYIIHRIFKHREKSSIKRYLLSREYNDEQT